MPMKSSVCIFGFGYTAEYLANALAAQNFAISGTSRNPETRKKFATLGYQMVDFTLAGVTSILQESTHVFITTPPNETTPDPTFAFFSEVIVQSCQHLSWVGYASSTGVYGDHAGGWVDESSPSLDVGAQGKARLAAESAWLACAKSYDLPLHIFRLSGIYGPQRNALQAIRGGKQYSIFKKDQVFSRIHVSDIVNTLLASIQRPMPYSIYNVSDDLPAAAYEVDRYAADLLGRPALPLIPFEEATLSPVACEFYRQNRRVSNAKIKQQLDVKLLYPSYRQGLTQLYQEMCANP
jgi:nucleoside-diphosphate-sugar epimerase